MDFDKLQTKRVVIRRGLSDHVYDELMISLVDGSTVPGATLNIDALAREMEVSQTPIREALARLESTGLVVRTALKGYRVAPLFSIDELVQVMDARLVIEPVNAELASSQAKPEIIEQLRETVSRLRSAPRGPSFSDFRMYWEWDERFHRLIAESSNNQFLLAAFSSLGGQVQRFRLFGGRGVTDAEHTIAEHGLIVEAIASGNNAAARDTMVAHLIAVKGRVMNERLSRH